MRRIKSAVRAGHGKLSRVRACLVAALLTVTTVSASQSDEIGAMRVDGPSTGVTIGLTDPLTCGDPSVGNWRSLCLWVTSDATAGASAAYAFRGTLVYDPDRAYYDADEDLVRPYRGALISAGRVDVPTLGSSSASVELTATKDGHQTGLLSVILNGLTDVPVGTPLSISLSGGDDACCA